MSAEPWQLQQQQRTELERSRQGDTVASTSTAMSKSPVFASSFSAFFPAASSSNIEYPTTLQHSNPDTGSSCTSNPFMTLSHPLRRHSVLACDADDVAAYPYRPADVADADGIAMDDDMMEDVPDTSQISYGAPTASSPFASTARPILGMPTRPRSLSQSTQVSSRSPPWPSSPPRSQQFLLARLASEQHQANVATAAANSGSLSRMPGVLRPGGSGIMDDDVLVEEPSTNAEGIDVSDSNDNETLGRSFNPLNPYSFKSGPPKFTQPNAPFGTFSSSFRNSNNPLHPTSSSASMGTASPSGYDSPGGLTQNNARCHSPDRSISSESLDPHSTQASFRPSRSSPSASLDGTAQVQTNQHAFLHSAPESNQESMRISPAPFDAGYERSFPPAPKTPPPISLRRSQSASHKLSSLSSFSRGPLAMSSASDFASMPTTAPLEPSHGGSQPVRMRSSSFSGFTSIVPHRSSNGNSSSSSSGDQQTAGRKLEYGRGRPPETRPEGELPKPRALSQSSGSESATPQVVKRAVNHKKGSLMPKSKDHLRIISQLRLETGEFEVASEAALHRITQSTAALPAFTSPRGNKQNQVQNSSATSPFATQRATGFGSGTGSPFAYAPGSASGFGHDSRRLSSSSGRPNIPTKNRFPEFAVIDDEQGEDSSGSDADYPGNEMLSDTGMVDEDIDAMSMAGDSGMGDGATSKNPAWAMRDPSSSLWSGPSKPLTPAAPASRTGTDMDVSPSSALGWSASSASRPGKRKLNDGERFESYSSAFKRRAVSPASTSSVSLSPRLTQTNLQNLALPSTSLLTALGPAASIGNNASGLSYQLSGLSNAPTSSMPASPVVGNGSWLSGLRSRGSSPAPSISSSAGGTRRWAGPQQDDDTRPNNRVDLNKMSLE